MPPQRVAVACDDGSARLFVVDDVSRELLYAKAMPCVEGKGCLCACYRCGDTLAYKCANK